MITSPGTKKADSTNHKQRLKLAGDIESSSNVILLAQCPQWNLGYEGKTERHQGHPLRLTILRDPHRIGGGTADSVCESGRKTLVLFASCAEE